MSGCDLRIFLVVSWRFFSPQVVRLSVWDQQCPCEKGEWLVVQRCDAWGRKPSRKRRTWLACQPESAVVQWVWGEQPRKNFIVLVLEWKWTVMGVQ